LFDNLRIIQSEEPLAGKLRFDPTFNVAISQTAVMAVQVESRSIVLLVTFDTVEPRERLCALVGPNAPRKLFEPTERSSFAKGSRSNQPSEQGGWKTPYTKLTILRIQGFCDIDDGQHYSAALKTNRTCPSEGFSGCLLCCLCSRFRLRKTIRQVSRKISRTKHAQHSWRVFKCVQALGFRNKRTHRRNVSQSMMLWFHLFQLRVGLSLAFV